MSNKTRRQSALVNNATQSYNTAISVYHDYMDNASPINITYYQISDIASRVDVSLENTTEVIGTSSSLYYNRIKNLPVRGTSPLDLVTQSTQRGAQETFITGEFIIESNLNIEPRPGDFFAFEDSTAPEMEQHLFQITDVQFDKATNAKNYKCAYKLHPKEKDMIEAQVVKKFIYDPESNGNLAGVGDSVIITEEEYANKEKVNDLIDELTDNFISTYYNEGMDTFTYQKSLDNTGTEFSYYWCPYLIHFIYKTKLLDRYNSNFMSEIYVSDINESTLPGIYYELGYRKSILHMVENKNIDNMTTDQAIKESFMYISQYDLNKPLSLPFFSTPDKYYLVEFNHQYNDKFFYMGAFNWISDNEDNIYFDIPNEYVYTKGEFINHLINNGFVTDTGDILKPEKLVNKNFYGIDGNNKLNLKEILKYTQDNTIYYADIGNLLKNSDEDAEGDIDLLIKIIKHYINNDLKLTDDNIELIKNYYYENSIKNYILMPVIIYILQQLNQ